MSGFYTQQRARLVDQDQDTAEAIVLMLLQRIPAWLPAASSNEVATYRHILKQARGLKRAKRSVRWIADVHGVATDFEELRVAIYQRTGT